MRLGTLWPSKFDITARGIMYSHAFSAVPDPDYRHEAALYLRDAVETLTNFEVAPDPGMGDRLIEIDARARQIRVRPGEPFRRFHTMIGRATLYVIGGEAWAPEFSSRPQLTVVRDIPEDPKAN